MDGRLISKKSFESYKPEPFTAGPSGRTEARVVEGSGPLADLLRKSLAKATEGAEGPCEELVFSSDNGG